MFKGKESLRIGEKNVDEVAKKCDKAAISGNKKAGLSGSGFVGMTNQAIFFCIFCKS